MSRIRHPAGTASTLTVRVCDSIACELAGARELFNALPDLLGPDVRVLHAPCVGRCETAPVAVVGQNPVPHATAQMIETLVREGAANIVPIESVRNQVIARIALPPHEA